MPVRRSRQQGRDEEREIEADVAHRSEASKPLRSRRGLSKGIWTRSTNPLERLELLAGDDDAVAAFLDEIACAGRASGDARRAGADEHARGSGRLRRGAPKAVTALESLGRHGYHAFRPTLGWGRAARAALLRRARRPLRRRLVSPPGVDRPAHLTLAARDPSARRLEGNWSCCARALRRHGAVEIFKRRGGRPALFRHRRAADLAVRDARAGSRGSWKRLVGNRVRHRRTAITLVGSWIVLRGAAMASRRIRLASRGPLQAVWTAVGHCGRPPRDQSRKFAIIAIALTVLAWIVLPAIVGLALTT